MDGRFLIAWAVAYLCGSLPTGYLAGRARGVDLRKVGSGNIGATNVVRTLGKRTGIAVFAIDVLKGLLPTLLLSAWLERAGGGLSSPDATALALGLGCIVGHVFPVWLGFKGGKGVATSAGALAALAPLAVLLALVVWFVLLKATRYVSVASMGAALAFPLLFVAVAGPAAALHERRVVTVVAAALALVIVALHRKNVRRLLRGEEPRIQPRGSKSAGVRP